MKRILKFLQSPPLLLAAVALLVYGILAPQLGFYWDGLAMSWIRYQLGQEAFTQYYSTNRPAWGLWHGFLTKFIPQQPLFWQILALFWRWLTSVLLWGILTQLFPTKKRIALAGAFLLLLYTGFNQQSVSFVYGYYLVIYSLYLFSIFAMLWTQKKTRFSGFITVLGLLSSALNLLMAEYFFTLDLIRPFLLWIFFLHLPDSKQQIRRVFSAWLPYLVIFLAGVGWRSLVFNNQVYEYSLLDELRATPLLTLWELVKTVFLSLYTTLIAAWGQAFMLPDFALQGRVTIAIYLGIIFITFALIIFAYLQKSSTVSERSRSANGGVDEERLTRALHPSTTPFVPRARRCETAGSKTVAFRSGAGESLRLIFLGIIAALLAGIPFWLTGLPVSLGFPANRATLSFMLGSVFFLVGLISLIPRKNLRIAFFALIIAFSAGRQFLWADEFRRDWIVHRNFFWQMSWRIPALEEDTLILLNEGALKFYADNSLSTPLNWIYAPDATAEHIPYMLFYPRSRFGVDGEKLAENMPLTHDFIAGEFNGNSAQMVLINFSPPGCLHIIDPEIDSENKFISDLLIRDAASFSRPELILTEGMPSLPEIYAPEPKHGWCYYYLKADLARQRGDWEQVVKLGEKVFASGDYPNDPTENFVFIEAYAHVDDWGNAEQLSTRAKRISPSYMMPLLCPLWERIDAETPDNPEKKEVLSLVIEDLGCK